MLGNHIYNFTQTVNNSFKMCVFPVAFGECTDLILYSTKSNVCSQTLIPAVNVIMGITWYSTSLLKIIPLNIS